MPVYRLNEGEISFPSPMYARRDGLLAVLRREDIATFLQ